MKKLTLTLTILSIVFRIYAQGIDSIIVEEFHVITSEEAATDVNLVEGAKTYRIFVDLAPGYSLIAVAGFQAHDLTFSTSTNFYNASLFGGFIKPALGEQVPHSALTGAQYYDSWVTIGRYSAEPSRNGVLLSEDTDGTLDGYLEGFPNDPLTSQPYTVQLSPGLAINASFGDPQGSEFSTNDGAYYIGDGISGPTENNRVLIGQFTTDGEFSFILNLQLRAPDTSDKLYVAKSPVGDEIHFPGLSYPEPGYGGCLNTDACNYNENAAYNIHEQCVFPAENCIECNGDGTWDSIDVNNNNILDCKEVLGCTDPSACNYNINANVDDGTCIYPLENCVECLYDGYGNPIGYKTVDTDEDGVLDCEEVPGCTTEDACNFDPLATDDDGSCLIPAEGCEVCDGDTIKIIDENADGIADCLENPGCTNQEACNYDALATYDDGSCLIPDQCNVCEENKLVLVDDNNDGYCDFGCTNPDACNYNIYSILDDGSCLFPDSCHICVDGDLMVIDKNNNGICDLNDPDYIPGCKSSTACNYNVNATVDDGSCVEPVVDCIKCEVDMFGKKTGRWDTIDVNNNNIPDCMDTIGCTNPDACNFNKYATTDDGTCLVPVEDCAICSGTALDSIDFDNDGIPNCRDQKGCMNPVACNYNPYAIEDDYCLIPDSCTWCDDNQLLDIDTDNDGIRDCDEIPGCTNMNACNYDGSATENDGSCIFPVENCIECIDNAANIIDTDGDGLCDANDGLEKMIYEIYYISDEKDSTDSNGGKLPPGSVTYRVYADLLPGWRLIAIAGYSAHQLIFETSTEFFNYGDGRGERFGLNIRHDKLDNGTLPLDSWVTLGAASNAQQGVPKNIDPDGSVLSGNDGGSMEIPGGLLTNNLATAGVAISQNDGLIENTDSTTVTSIDITPGLDLSMFDDENGPSFSTNDGSWYNVDGVKGATPENIILIGQFTTNGTFRCELNLQITPDYGASLDYVAKNPLSNEIQDSSLIFSSTPGCMDAKACNYNPDATIENGTCVFEVDDCITCNNDGTWTIKDNNGNNIPDCNEIEGCMNPDACNYQSDATKDDGSCIVPEDTCHVCDNGELADICSSIGNTKDDIEKISVYPIPASDEIIIDIMHVEGKAYTYVITDLSGKNLIQKQIWVYRKNHKEKVDISDLNEGMYLLRISSEKRQICFDTIIKL